MNELMERFNRSILSEPEIGITLQASSRAISQHALLPEHANARAKNLDPLLVHSEGQLGALAVSMLCAASLTFPWSKWPALIMDDPLQHNDVVHASAFADMLRNLINDRNYQVFLSTHDVAQAEFLRRKFQAGNIPCTSVYLLGHGPGGTQFEIRN